MKNDTTPAEGKESAQTKSESALRGADCSASEYRGTRCPICFWALYDGDWCQGPKWCANRGKSVENPARLTNAEAMEMIRHYCPTCGRHVPCRHCEPNAQGMARRDGRPPFQDGLSPSPSLSCSPSSETPTTIENE